MDPIQETLEETNISAKESKSIVYAHCLFKITSPEFLFFVDGLHVYHFTNPVGNSFQIRLFSKASGCKEEGSPSLEYTWFPNFAWNFALCANCNRHLGWKYHSEWKTFFGLIANQIIEI